MSRRAKRMLKRTKQRVATHANDGREISSLKTFRPLFRSMIVNRTFLPIPVWDCAHRRALSTASASFDASNP